MILYKVELVSFSNFSIRASWFWTWLLSWFSRDWTILNWLFRSIVSFLKEEFSPWSDRFWLNKRASNDWEATFPSSSPNWVTKTKIKFVFIFFGLQKFFLYLWECRVLFLRPCNLFGLSICFSKPCCPQNMFCFSRLMLKIKLNFWLVLIKSLTC